MANTLSLDIFLSFCIFGLDIRVYVEAMFYNFSIYTTKVSSRPGENIFVFSKDFDECSLFWRLEICTNYDLPSTNISFKGNSFSFLRLCGDNVLVS